MRILVFIVNYQADEPLTRCIQSLDAAAAESQVHLDVHVLDNSEYGSKDLANLRELLKKFNYIDVTLHIPSRNAGYFGGLGLAQELCNKLDSNLVIYSNPDVHFAPDFFVKLRGLMPSFSGVLAPAIVSIRDCFDQNPKYFQRLSVSKLRRLRRIYSIPIAFRIFMVLARIKERFFVRRTNLDSHARSFTEIYAPHGAVLIFTDLTFFKSLPSYPCFLFGEELFIAEEAARRQVSIFYHPTLRVDDLRSQSVGKIPSDRHRRLMLESVEFILSEYY